MPKIEVRAIPLGMETQVVGYIDDESVCVASHRDGVWEFFKSYAYAIPCDFSAALVFSECVARVLARAKEYGAE